MTRAQSKLRIEIRQLDFAFVCTLKRALTRLLLLLLLLGSYFAPRERERDRVFTLLLCTRQHYIIRALPLT